MVWLIQWNLRKNRALKIKSQMVLLPTSRKWYSESKRKHSTSMLTVRTQNKLNKGSMMLNLNFKINQNISMRQRTLESSCVKLISTLVSKDHHTKSFISQMYLTQKNASQIEEPNQSQRIAESAWLNSPLWLKELVRCLIEIICSNWQEILYRILQEVVKVH